MKFVIVLALLCSCCYAAEQSVSATQQEERLPPQHIKDFVEQHIKHVKQQIPFLQQKIKAEKSKIDDHQVPENIKKFIEAHINQVLQYVSQQKQKQPLDSIPIFGVPPLMTIQTIEKLKENIKDIMKQTETHILQAISQGIAYKNHLNDKHQIEDKTVQIPDRQHVVPVRKRGTQNEPVVPEHIQDMVHQIHQYVPLVINQHIAQVQENDALSTSVVQQVPHHVPQVINQNVGNDAVVQEIPSVPHNIQSIAEQVHQHVPQVINQNVVNVDEKLGQETPTVPGHIQGIVEQTHRKNSIVVPGDIQEGIEQINHHVPPVIEEKVIHVQNSDAEGGAVVPDYVQGIVEQSHHHVPQVHKKDNQPGPVIPSNVLDVVERAHQHVPQVINSHVAQTEGNNDLENAIAPSNIEDIVQQIDQVINRDEDHVAQDLNHVASPDQRIPLTDVKNNEK